MENNGMTIHRALSELKLIDAKIDKQISELQPVAINQKGKKISGFVTEEEFKTRAESSYQSVTDLIARKIAIKSKIVESNSKTTVKVGGKDFTVADAITFKKIVETKKKLITHLTNKLKTETGNLNKNNEQVNANGLSISLAVVGNDQSKKDETQAVAAKKAYIDGNEFHLVDPLKIQDKIASLEKETGDFEAEIDAVLSESNAVTIITI